MDVIEITSLLRPGESVEITNEITNGTISGAIKLSISRRVTSKDVYGIQRIIPRIELIKANTPDLIKLYFLKDLETIREER